MWRFFDAEPMRRNKLFGTRCPGVLSFACHDMRGTQSLRETSTGVISLAF
jgi:hypothetical protein